MSAVSKPKNKPVRDSFTMPKQEYAQIAEMKQRAAKLGRPTKKSEVLRAALALLSALSDQHLVGALQALPSIQTGRPKAEPIPATPVAKSETKAKPVAKKVAAPRPVAKKSRAPKASQA